MCNMLMDLQFVVPMQESDLGVWVDSSLTVSVHCAIEMKRQSQCLEFVRTRTDKKMATIIMFVYKSMQ